MDLSNYGIYMPSPQPPGQPHKARRVLLTPMSNASREALRASLSSYGKGRAAKIDRLYSTLDNINSTDVRSHFHAIKMLDWKTPSKLTSIQGRPAALVVNEMTDTLMQICTQAQATALQVSETKSTNQGMRACGGSLRV